MRIYLLRALGLAVLTVIFLPPVQAQIVAVDEDGKQVFINLAPEELKAILRYENSRVLVVAPFPSMRPAPRLRLLGTDVEQLINETAKRYQLDPALVRAIIQVESSGNPWAVSQKGAVGLMQVVPETGRKLGVNNLFDPQENLEAGVRYLKSLLDAYQGNLALSLAAYNAGPKAVEKHGGVPPYRETQQYVRKVTDVYFSPGDRGRYSTSAAGSGRKIYGHVDDSGRTVFRND